MTIGSYAGCRMINIREYYHTKEGEWLPTKKVRWCFQDERGGLFVLWRAKGGELTLRALMLFGEDLRRGF